jgi:hypothetical protein
MIFFPAAWVADEYGVLRSNDVVHSPRYNDFARRVWDFDSQWWACREVPRSGCVSRASIKVVSLPNQTHKTVRKACVMGIAMLHDMRSNFRRWSVGLGGKKRGDGVDG